VHDPLADPAEALAEYGIALKPLEDLTNLDAVIIAVAHTPFIQLDPTMVAAMHRPGIRPVVMDVKGVLPKDRFLTETVYWRL
jgi:UDP-N-acetyl-D-galactosamine dehydrogenase